ncbi:MAG: 16S rRNA (cytidine(1402)-2'-O)-methyltransferase, partial [bacterium]|nr:16S rRNA (cytidine(1402)-2'-O)-methyltransferase [bacterium]
GNLEDITLRALRTLKEADVIYAEDTRVTMKILSKYGFTKPIFRLDAAKESKKTDEVIERLEKGERVAYVSDAGTPGISDPGAWLVACVRAAGFRVETIPGPSSLTAALSIAGIPLNEFTFLGFLPHKKGRQTALKGIAASEHPIVLFESPHRIIKLMKELETHAPDKKVTIAKELTKIHEEVLVGTGAELAERLEREGKARGEFVVLIS